MDNEVCQVHQEPAIGQCIKCGHPVCRICKEERGYYCSDECLAATASFVNPEQTQKQQRQAEISHKLGIAFKYSFLGVFLILLAVLGWWIWDVFYNPVGRLEWKAEVSMPVKNFKLLKKSKKELLFLAGDKLIGVNPVSGQKVTNKTVKNLSGYDTLITDYDFCNIAYKDNKIAVYDKKWAFLWDKSIKDKVIEFVGANDSIVMVVLGLDWSKYEDYSPKQWKKLDRSKIVRLYHLESGKELGDKKFDPDEMAGRRVCLTDDDIIYLSYPKKRNGPGTILNFQSLKTGKGRKKFFELGIRWGPVLRYGYLWVKTGDNLVAMTPDGQEEVLQLNSVPFWGEAPFVYKKPFLFIQGEGSIVCIDLKKDTMLWQNNFAERFSSIAYTKKRIYFITEDSKWVDRNLPQQKMKLPGMEQVKDDKFIKGIMENAQQMQKKRLKTVGTLFCIEAKTGKTLWKKEGFRGDLAASSKRLLVITDTAQTSRMNVANKGRGITMLKQLDINSGKVYYERKTNLGLAEPYLVLGKHLICPEYERVASGISGMFGFKEGREPDYLGVVSFLLK